MMSKLGLVFCEECERVASINDVDKEGKCLECQEIKINSNSHHLVSAEVEVSYEGESLIVELVDIPCLWEWSEVSREEAMYWSVADAVDKEYVYDWFSVISFSGSPALAIH